MEPIRTHAKGFYEIYGRDGDEPWKVAPDKLDTSLSLGTGKLGAADKWSPGIRDNAEACEAQIAVYAERWASKNDPPDPQILVLGEADGKGGYRHTSRVIDGAMWVAAAKKAGIPLVPVYVVHPTLPHLEDKAMWLYFNSITNGLAPTDRQRQRILKELAKYARDARAVTDTEIMVDGKKVKRCKQWVDEYALATATPVDVITETTKGIFATRRTAEERKEDVEEAKAEIERAKAEGEKPSGIVGKIAKKRGKSKTAIRKALKRAGIDTSGSAGKTNGKKDTASAQGVVRKAVRTFKGALSGEGKDAAARINAAAAALKPMKPVIHQLIDEIEGLTASEDPEQASLAERLPQAVAIWGDALDGLLGELLRLADQLNVYGDKDRAHRDARVLASLFNLATETLRRNNDPLVRELNGSHAGRQTLLLK